MDFGPSLMDEVFKELEINKTDYGEEVSDQQKIINDCNTNVKNEIKEIASKMALNKETNKKKSSVKPISASDKLTLDSAIAMAKELATQSMMELDNREKTNGVHDIHSNANNVPKTPTSPTKKKFPFKFKNSPKVERRNFSDETENISDIQSTITQEAIDVYNSIIEKGEGLEKFAFDTDSKKNDQNDFEQLDNEMTDPNPLRMLRNGVRIMPKVRGNKSRFTTAPQTASLARLTANANRSTFDSSSIIENQQQNYLPLPPRDRSKPLPVLKMHQRKYPLVLPSSHSLDSGDALREPVMSTFRPNMPVYVSCPEPPSDYVAKQSQITKNSSLDSNSKVPSLNHSTKTTHSYM